MKLFQIRPLAVEEMSFKGLSISSSGNHFVQQSRTILAFFVLGHKRNISVIFKSCHWPQRCHLKFLVFFFFCFFLFLVLVTILFGRAESF